MLFLFVLYFHAKLLAYGFSLSALKSIHSYLKSRKERTKIGSAYGSFFFFFFLIGFAPCKAEQPLRGMELQEKETQKG